jgi:hypothetical protein
MAALAGFGAPRPKREPVEVKEPKPQDKTLDKLLGVRKQRLDRLERERKDARDAWKAARAAFREKKLQWRAAMEDMKMYWAKARKEFLAMHTTSGQYQKSKAVYERMKQEATDKRVLCLESLTKCKARRNAFFDARARVLTANRQQEKLTVMRDELRSRHLQEEQA